MPQVPAFFNVKMATQKMIPQDTGALDWLLEVPRHPRALYTLWPNKMQTLSIDRWAIYLINMDRYTPQHLRDINTWFRGEDESHRLERLTYMLIRMLHGVSNSAVTWNENVEGYVGDPANYDSLFGISALQDIYTQPEDCRKVVGYLRSYNDDLNDGELGFAVAGDFIRGVEAGLERQRKAFYTARKAAFAPLKEDLMAAVWHPKRVEAWLEVGGHELLDMMA